MGVELETPDPCDWEEDNEGTFLTSCGRGFVFTEGDPMDNGFTCCPFCGKELKQVLTQDVDN